MFSQLRIPGNTCFILVNICLSLINYLQGLSWECSCKEDKCNDQLNTLKFMQYVTSTTTTTTTTSTTAGPLQCHTCSGFCEDEEDEGSLELCAAEDNACVVEFKLSDDGSASEVSRKCGARLSDSNNDIECRELGEEGSWTCSCLGNECNNALETKKMMGSVTSTTTTTTTTTTVTTITTSEELTTTTDDDDDGYTTYTWITRPTQAGPPPPPPKSYYHLYIFFHYLIRILGFLIFLAGMGN